MYNQIYILFLLILITCYLYMIKVILHNFLKNVFVSIIVSYIYFFVLVIIELLSFAVYSR